MTKGVVLSELWVGILSGVLAWRVAWDGGNARFALVRFVMNLRGGGDMITGCASMTWLA